MADEFQLGNGGNWWDASRNRSFDGGATHESPSISTTLNAIASYGWSTEMVDMKPNDSETPSAAAHDQSSAGGGGGCGGGVLANPNLQMVGLGLSSHNKEWNQALLGEKGEGSFRSLLQEGLNTAATAAGGFQQESGTAAQEHWRQKVYSGASSEDSPANNDFKQINHRGFSLEASSNDSTIASQNLTNATFQVDSASGYGMLLPENQHQDHHSAAYQNRSVNYNPYPSSSGGYGGGASEMVPSWNKYPPFMRTSPPPAAAVGNSHLHFVNSTPYWNPPTALQTQNIPATPSFDEKPKKEPEAATTTTTKKRTTETSNKRPRNETSSPLPAFKVRKEKMGDRITALQQLVSPFGKTDTASVLSEAIEYIKFLHEQVGNLTTPYMKINGAPTQHQQNCDKSKDPDQARREDLRSRGLCLVPISSTFPVTHETGVDFWTPTFGVTFR